MKGRERRSNFRNEDINPCIQESEAAQKCLQKLDSKNQNCSEYFNKYKDCKKLWSEISTLRQKFGIRPSMPNKVEREKIMEQRNKGKKVFACQ